MKQLIQNKSHHKKPVILFLILLIFSFVSCKNNAIIEEDKFVQIYSALVIAKDTLKTDHASVQKEIFSRYKVTDEQYENTIEYYNEDPARWEKFFDKVIENVSGLQKKGKSG